jgi:hypothetical protein
MSADVSTWGASGVEPLRQIPDGIDRMPAPDAALTIEGWFLHNFDCPDNEQSNMSRYGFIWGGPYFARDILDDVFCAVMSDDARHEALYRINQCGWRWTPAKRRIPSLSDRRAPIEAAVIIQAFDEMQTQLANLESTVHSIDVDLKTVSYTSISITEQLQLITASQREIIGKILATLKQQPPGPSETPAGHLRLALEQNPIRLKRILPS